MSRAMRLVEWRMRLATCRLRALPDFLIIGAPRTGTTSLYHYLIHQSSIAPSFRKEVHFFSRTGEYEKGPCRYRANFPLRSAMGSGRITGEATPTYLLRPNVPQRVAEVIPTVRLIAILRDPVERAISSWHHFKRLGEEPRSLEEAVSQELEALGDPRTDPGPAPEARPGELDFAHVWYGRYADHLRRWFAVFEREQILMVLSEDLFADPEAVYLRVLDHLDVTPRGLPEFRRLNQVPREPSSGAAREMLSGYFREPNRDLHELTGLGADWGP